MSDFDLVNGFLLYLYAVSTRSVNFNFRKNERRSALNLKTRSYGCKISWTTKSRARQKVRLIYRLKALKGLFYWCEIEVYCYKFFIANVSKWEKTVVDDEKEHGKLKKDEEKQLKVCHLANCTLYSSLT